MTNYVVLYNFDKSNTTTDFAKQLRQQFPQHQNETSSGMPYFAFAAREEPEVEDTIRHMVNHSQLGDFDFIALYFSDPDNNDLIKRVILVGSETELDRKMEQVSEAEHNNMLIDLLALDLVQQ